jgi:hypothetical protein
MSHKALQIIALAFGSAGRYKSIGREFDNLINPFTESRDDASVSRLLPLARNR